MASSRFNSNSISEWRKWRIGLLLTLRYFSICTALVAISNFFVQTLMKIITGSLMSQPEPIRLLGAINTAITYITIGGQLFNLFRYGEHWTRWIEVIAFLPISLVYFLFQAVRARPGQATNPAHRGASGVLRPSPARPLTRTPARPLARTLARPLTLTLARRAVSPPRRA